VDRGTITWDGVGKTSYGPCRKVLREDPLSGSSILVLVDTVEEGRNYAAMAFGVPAYANKHLDVLAMFVSGSHNALDNIKHIP
jgi:hypothetical protein